MTQASSTAACRPMRGREGVQRVRSISRIPSDRHAVLHTPHDHSICNLIQCGYKACGLHIRGGGGGVPGQADLQVIAQLRPTIRPDSMIDVRAIRPVLHRKETR